MHRLSLALLKAFHYAVTRTWLLMALACALGLASLGASVATGAWHWFARSGALVVAIGAILSTRPVLRDQLTEMIRVRAPEPEEVPVPPADAPRRDRRACFCGFWVVATGTLVWAYGDLLGCLVSWSGACLPG